MKHCRPCLSICSIGKPQARCYFRQLELEEEEEEEEAEKDGGVRAAEEKSQVQFYLHSVGMGKDP